MTRRSARLAALLALFLGLAPGPRTFAAPPPRVHGLWVWKGPEVLASPQDSRQLTRFCQQQGISEVYVSVFTRGELPDSRGLAQSLAVLRGAGLRVEALLSSIDADQPGKHRDKLLAHVRAVVAYNTHQSDGRIDGIHLDIEPQQRPENKGPGNLRFLPDLVETYRAVRAIAEPAGLSVAADIQNKLLKGTREERRMLLTALPRLTLMMYELSTPSDGDSVTQKSDKIRSSSRAFLEMAYQGLDDPVLATMVIALRTPDYGKLLPQMLQTLDEANGANPHYQGWARHSYNDQLQGASP